jgi:hypothetical protein
MLLGTTDNRTTEKEDRKGKGKAKEVDEEDKQPATAGGAPLAVSRLCDVGARNWWQWTPLHFASTLPSSHMGTHRAAPYSFIDHSIPRFVGQPLLAMRR